MENLFLAYAVIFLLPLLFYFFRIKKRELRDRARLPPGSMGWPFIGETLQLYSQDPNVFLAAKQKRSRTGRFSRPIYSAALVSYMLASPEASRSVLVTQADFFKPTYPKSKERLIGPSALFFHQGAYHNRLRKLVQSSFSPEAIKNWVASIEAMAVSVTDSWTGGNVINTYDEMKRFSFEVGIFVIFGRLEAHYREELKKNYCIVERAYNSFPINIPGTPYKKALSARKRLSEILSELINERKEKRLAHRDFLGSLFDSKNEKGETLTQDQIADNIIGVLFAAQDTTASVITWILKYLHDDPKLLDAVKAEQKPINQSNEEGNRPLTWTQIKNMPVTYKVILEGLRMASVVSFTFREAVADVEYKGYLIPKGWKVMPLFRNIHHDPKFFPDPQTFDLSRFEVAPKPNTFMPFGSGVHACPGNELAKLEMLIMTHHIVTKFRWEVVGSKSGIQYGPFPVPVHGLPARFWPQSTT